MAHVGISLRRVRDRVFSLTLTTNGLLQQLQKTKYLLSEVFWLIVMSN